MAKDNKMNQVILGLLNHENLTGYEIKKRIDSYFFSCNNFISMASGIFFSLNKLFLLFF